MSQLLCKATEKPQSSDWVVYQLFFVMIELRQLQLHQLAGKCSRILYKLVLFGQCLFGSLLYLSPR